MTYPKVKLSNNTTWFRSRTNDFLTDFSSPINGKNYFFVGGDNHPDYINHGCYDDDLVVILLGFNGGTWPSSGPPKPEVDFIGFYDSSGRYTTLNNNQDIQKQFPRLNDFQLAAKADGGPGLPKACVWIKRAISNEYNAVSRYSFPATGGLPIGCNSRQFNLQAGSFKDPVIIKSAASSGRGLQVSFPAHTSIDSRAWASTPNPSPIKLNETTLYNGSNVSIAMSAKNSQAFRDKSFPPNAASTVGAVNCGDGWFIAVPGDVCWGTAHVAPSDGRVIGGFGVNFVGDQFTQGLTFPWASLVMQIASAPDYYISQSEQDPYLFKENFASAQSLEKFKVVGQYGVDPGEVIIR